MNGLTTLYNDIRAIIIESRNRVYTTANRETFEENVRTETDKPTIGIVLCTERDNTVVRYSVMNDSDHLFASEYKLYLPTEEELVKELEKSRKLIEDEQ
ncbi:MAG: PDDEXK nuclease domain-containing protein [Tannerellaceae bacterium]|jgi:hypothetical protein|nr:PDDEXK nuclease domain-containing protein [Tannerellaceae bacterium]